MYKVTNQQLYADVAQAMDGIQLDEHSAEEMYSAIHDTLQDQEGFSEELIEKCASVAFDAVNDLYSQSQGVEVQSTYSGENLETLFAAETQEVYATMVGRAANYIGSAARGLGKGVGYIGRRKAYAESMTDNKHDIDAANEHGTGFWGRVAAGAKGQYRKNKEKSGKDASDAKSILKGAQVRGSKSFFGRFKDDKGAFMGLGKKGGGIKKWAKENQAQAITAGAVGAAAVGGAGYLAYRAYKKRKAAQAAQKQNATQQVQPNK